MNKRELGGCYEKIAADYLRKQGLYIKEMNYRCSQGEIDIIARDGEYLVFVEVKFRKDEKKGSPLEAVGYWKKKVISKIAKQYIVLHYHTLDIACRFDVVGILKEEIVWIKDAFSYTE